MDICQQIWNNWREKRGYCKNCPLKDARYPFYGFGDYKAEKRIMVIGTAPAYNIRRGEAERIKDVKTFWVANRIFNRNRKDQRNPLYRTLEKLLSKSCLKPQDIYFTNLRKCNAPFEQRILYKATKECSHYLKEEIEKLDPQLIIAFGRDPTNAVLKFHGKPQLGMHYAHGRLIKLKHPTAPGWEKKYRTLLPLKHWGYIERWKPNELEDYYDEIATKFQQNYPLRPEIIEK